MEMTSLNISLPKALKQYVEMEVAKGTYSTPSEYVRELLREQQKRRAKEKLEAALLQGLTSGPAVPVNQKYWAQKRLRLLKHHKSKTDAR